MDGLLDFPHDVIRIPYRKNFFPMYLSGLQVEGVYYGTVEFDRTVWMNWKFTKIGDDPKVPLAVPGWVCRNCKTTFFGINFEDLQHECTKNRDEYFSR